MRINHNISSLSVQGSLFKTARVQSRCIQKLSTGLRINSAADDVAGLSISEKLRVQVRCGKQAMRNSQDAIALLQIGEGAMNEIHDLLQRGRELALQAASDTLTDTERAYIQQEIEALFEEINRIAEATNYNGISACQSSVDTDLADTIIEGLKRTWLNDAEKLVINQFGFSAAANTPMTVYLESSIATNSAYVRSYGMGNATELHIDVSAANFNPGFSEGTNEGISGGSIDIRSDRVIAHEMVHAMIYQNVANASDLPTWFHEGIAEFIHGGDEILKSTLGTGSPTQTQAQSMIHSNNLDEAWKGTFGAYATGYSAVRYLDWRIRSSGSSFKSFMQSLKGGAALGDAIAAHTGGRYSDTNSFIDEFQGSGAQNGAWFVASSGQIVLNDFGSSEADTGAVGGGSPTSVVNNTVTAADDNPTGFDVTFATVAENLSIRCGSNASDENTIDISTAGVSSSNLGLDSVDVSTQSGAAAAIQYFTDAIESLSLSRNLYGALVNRLTHAVDNQQTMVINSQFAESLIRDSDFAVEASQCTKNNILTQSATAMLAQANFKHQNVIQLLKPW